MNISKNRALVIGGLLVAAIASGAFFTVSMLKSSQPTPQKKVLISKKPAKKAKAAKMSGKKDLSARMARDFQTKESKQQVSRLTDDEYNSLAPEMKKLIDTLQEALDNNDAKTVSKIAEQILVTQRKKGQDAVPPFVREKTVEAIGIFLPYSLADLVGFMADSDPDVLQDVMDRFSEAIDDPDLGDVELSAILSSVGKILDNEDAIDSLFLGIESDMRNSVAIKTYLDLWENGSKPVKDKIIESIADFTGEEDITTPEQLKEWLEQNPDDEDDEDFYGAPKDNEEE